MLFFTFTQEKLDIVQTAHMFSLGISKIENCKSHFSTGVQHLLI